MYHVMREAGGHGLPPCWLLHCSLTSAPTEAVRLAAWWRPEQERTWQTRKIGNKKLRSVISDHG